MKKTAEAQIVQVQPRRIWTVPQIILSAIIVIVSLSCLLPFINVLAISPPTRRSSRM